MSSESGGIGPTAVLILAAGKGTRMKSDLAKVLHPLMGRSMLAHVLNAARYLKPERQVVVVGHQAEQVREAVGAADLTFVTQAEQLGTGHAVLTAQEALADFNGTVLILSGDVPLLSPQTMTDFLAAHVQSRVALSVMTVILEEPGMYGRVVRDPDGWLVRIVEARDASPEELALEEINAGIYAVEASNLFGALRQLDTDNDQGEYYLTDLVEILRGQGLAAAAILCPDPEEVMGINDRSELAHAEAVLRLRTNQAWMKAGVTMIDPMAAYVETGVKLAPDVTLWPGVVLTGRTSVGRGTIIGPHCRLDNAQVGRLVRLEQGVVVKNARIEDSAALEAYRVVKHTGETE